MGSNRCSTCGIDWPLNSDYRRCPSCKDKTSPISNIEALDDDEAKSLKAHYEFEHYYEKTRGVAADAP